MDSFLGHVSSEIVNPAINLLFAIAIVYFLYGVFRLFTSADNEEVRIEAKAHMIWGVIGLGIMMGVWGILNIILNTLGVKDIKIDDKDEHNAAPSETFPSLLIAKGPKDLVEKLLASSSYIFSPQLLADAMKRVSQEPTEPSAKHHLSTSGAGMFGSPKRSSPTAKPVADAGKSDDEEPKLKS